MITFKDKKQERPQNLTIFVSAFHSDAMEEIERNLAATESIWQGAEIHIDDNIMHEYIQSAFRSAASTGMEARDARGDLDFHMYSLRRSNDGSCIIDEAWQQMFQSKRKLTMDKGKTQLDEKGTKFRVNLDKGTLFEPHLIIWPYSHVGLVTFSTTLCDRGATLEDLIDFNNAMHKTDNQSPIFYLEDELTLKTTKTLKPEALQGKRKGLNTCKEKLKPLLSENGEEYETGMTSASLLEQLYASMGSSDSIKRFDTKRLYPMTFALLGKGEIPKEEEKLKDLVLLARGEDHKYEVSAEQALADGNILKTFDNIYFATFVEGSSILIEHPLTQEEIDARGEGREQGFSDNFMTASLDKRYLWVFLLSMLLRHSQQYWITRLSRHHSKSETLRKELIIPVSRVKASSYFTNISNYTQINQYYTFLNRNLYIERNFAEIEQKMLPLYEAIAEDEREAEERREKEERLEREQRKEEEYKRERDRRDQRKRDKEEEERREKEKEHKTRNREMWFTVGFSCLTIASVINDAFLFIYYDKEQTIWNGHTVFLLVIYVIAVALIWGLFHTREKETNK